MKNKILYGDFIFYDNSISKIATYLDDSEIMLKLPIDTATTIVNRVGVFGQLRDSAGVPLNDSAGIALYAASDTPIDLSGVPNSEPIYFYHGDELQSKFYIESIKKGSGNTYNLSCMSSMGRLAKKTFYGGYYQSTPAGEIIDAIFAEVPSIRYTVDDDVRAALVKNVLLIQSCRDALREVLFSIGASVTKDENGDPRFYFNSADVALAIDIRKEYKGGNTEELKPVSAVNVTEHEWYVSDKVAEVSLFDNVSAPEAAVAVNQIVTFPDPVRVDTLRAVGIDGEPADTLAITPISVNACRVDGVGILLGIPYAHSTIVIRKENPDAVEEYEETYSDHTLVSSLNSENVAERVYAYHVANSLINVAVVKDRPEIKPGSLVSVIDPYSLERVTGFVEKMGVNYSTILKADSTILTGWAPNHLGNTYDRYLLLTAEDLGGLPGEDITWTVPEELRGKTVSIVLFGAAGGGQAGYNGENGHSGTGSATSYPWNPGEGGLGGQPGQPGQLGRYIRINLTLTESQYVINFGVGGDGGQENGQLGIPGGDTVFGSISTVAGTQLLGEYVNMLSGDVVAAYSEAGISGAKGGRGGNVNASGGITLEAESGEDLLEWHGGAANRYYWSARDDGFRSGSTAGGGAAYGNNGLPGQTNEYDGGYSGNGADAINPHISNVACAGHGGFGGGGGGGGSCIYREGDTGRWQIINYLVGIGGLGSAGSNGGDGCVLIYYKEE